MDLFFQGQCEKPNLFSKMHATLWIQSRKPGEDFLIMPFSPALLLLMDYQILHLSPEDLVFRIEQPSTSRWGQ
jgi:hypothetical protein